jgi:hypothetical protein
MEPPARAGPASRRLQGRIEQEPEGGGAGSESQPKQIMSRVPTE